MAFGRDTLIQEALAAEIDVSAIGRLDEVAGEPGRMDVTPRSERPNEVRLQPLRDVWAPILRVIHTEIVGAVNEMRQGD